MALFEGQDWTKRPAAAKRTTAWKAVSLFAGCGGMDLGFAGGFRAFGQDYPKLPFRVVWANELNPHACATYRRNLGHDIRVGDVWEHLDSLPAKADVVIGGFPCQDISINGKQAGVDGARSGLYRAMVTAVDRVRPSVFVAENVKGLLMPRHQESLQRILKDFGALGYNLSYRLYNAADYGVPQARERVFIVGTLPETGAFRHPLPICLPEGRMTAREAIADLEDFPESPEINHIWSRANRSPEQGNRRLSPDRPSHTIRAECHGNIQFHYKLARRLSMREAARFQSFPDDFIFEAKLRETERQIGNAVPPVLAWHVAAAVADSLGG